MLGLRGARYSLARHALRTRHNSSQAARAPRPMPKTDDAGDDFRPSWVYVGSRVTSFLVIPAVGAYAVFFWDFGDHEHVFQPVRRWGASTINGFFSLSSAEKGLRLEDTPSASASGDASA